MADLYNDVGAFHALFGLVNFSVVKRDNVKPTLLPADVHEFRSKFMQEELDEYNQAIAEGDFEKAIDALCDLVYVALGTAHMHCVDFNAHWAEVHRANMAKQRSTAAREGFVDTRSKRGHSLDVVKPEGWTPPDHAPILARTVADFDALNGETTAHV